MEESEDDEDNGDGCDEDDGDDGYDGDDGDRGAELEADLSGKGNKTHVKHCLQCGQPIQQESKHRLCDLGSLFRSDRSSFFVMMMLPWLDSSWG